MRASTFAIVTFAGIGLACELQHKHEFMPHRMLAKRQETVFPPALTSDESTLISAIDNTTIEGWSYYYTHGRHLAGENRTMAQWTADRWAENGFESRLDEYITFLNYPVAQSLQFGSANGSREVNLVEAVLAEDETTSYPNSLPSFHGYSFTGQATAEYVYVGRGQQVDFQRLVTLGVPLEGKIALAKYGGPFRGLKVKNAQQYGMIGAVIFTDPGDDGNITEAKGVAAYPLGKARNPTQVQRGSVQFLSTYPGDPTTPGYPSKRNSPRTGITNVTPQIPSLPLSWGQAQPIVQALDGFGTPGRQVNRTNWVGAFNATYSTGPAPGVTLTINNEMQENITAIWNTIGIINGTSQDEVIVIGNHRDAWIVGGAADPNSGSAIMVELSKAFGRLLATGWKPKRTIVLASWDAEEYGLVGSTEWVEEYIPWLTTSAVSYLNIDVGASGPNPDISATPDLHRIAIETMKKVVYDNYRGYNNLTLYDVWLGLGGEVGVLGSGSDYTAFLHNGISSIDMGAGGGPTDAIYPYHSNYDSFHWMSTFGDPGYNTHKVMCRYLTLLAYEMSTRELLPLEPANYGVELTAYLADLEETIQTGGANYSSLDISPIRTAIQTFNTSAAALQAVIAANPDAAAIDNVNGKLRDYQRGFVSQGGLPNREFYKNVVQAPGLDTGYAPVTFGGVTEAITFYKDAQMAREWIERTAKGIERAAAIL
ncbi:hypothetical protein CAC42_7395 [Sphaceloma murrayae]|uniref:Glutamate carboxypeptidase 2 n=1 Tax=Sphaceloma murrayae TaxID=2082308 RepID=A0A2K1QWX6_9PEZI|nr:hypothetical protein CAC42_7395 [Sphaceloma murrayae]